MPIFKSPKNNEKKELEFELKYQRSLSLAERFRMAHRQSKLILRVLIDRGYIKPTEIIKREKDKENLKY
jgi:ribosomal protein S8